MQVAQASRQWFQKNLGFLLSHGFNQSKANYSLFTRGKGANFVALLVYVDDILLTGSSPKEITVVKTLLQTNLLLKVLGNAKYFLGLELSRSSQGIYLSQRKYCFQIIDHFSLLAAKPATYPMMPSLRIDSHSGEPLCKEDMSNYRRLIGRLLYLEISRPGISFAIHHLS